MFQVVFATPGMLHAGQSLQIFKKWAGNEKNMVRDYTTDPDQHQHHSSIYFVEVLINLLI